MGSTALLVALMAVAMTVARVRSQDGESIATSFLSGQSWSVHELFKYVLSAYPTVEEL